MTSSRSKSGVDQHRVEVAGVTGVGLLGWRQDERQAVEQVVVCRPQPLAGLEVFLDPLQLAKPQRRLRVGHVHLVAGFDHVVVPVAAGR